MSAGEAAWCFGGNPSLGSYIWLFMSTFLMRWLFDRERFYTWLSLQ